MYRLRSVLILLLILFVVNSGFTESKTIHHIRVDGAINPVSAMFMIKAVDRAQREGAEALIIELDTPGGLLEATRDIVQTFLAAEVPVVVYVSPSGARAGSAGVFITMAAHVAAMAPGTNIGAAHPVSMGDGGMPGEQKDTTGSGVMSEKATNDAAALIRSIAEERERNIVWAESAVRESKSITAKVALEENVIDLIPADLDTLVSSLNGRIVKLSDREVTLNTTSASIEKFEMDWRERLFNRIVDPNIAYILMMLGIYGLIYELANPGAIFPGVIGVISILLAFLAFQTLPINAVGLGLIIVGILLLLLEIKMPSYGLLTVGGATSLFLGSILLIDTTIPFLKVSLSVIIPAVAGTVLFALFAVSMGLRAQRNKPTTGREGITGQIGEALEDIPAGGKGKVFVNGEYWMARTRTELGKGDAVQVSELKGMYLEVERFSGEG